jgi:signal transduction histidine kinase
MNLRRLIPRSLVGQTVAVLLAAVVLVHLGSMVAYRDSAFDAASAAHADQLAERLATVSRSLAQLPAAGRDEAAHGLSSVGLSLRWSERTEMGAMPVRDPDLVRLRDRLATLLPGQRGDGVRLGYADRQPPGDAHAMLGSVGLPDGSFLSFRVPMIGDEQPGLHAAVLSTSLMAGGVALVAILLMRSIGRPLRGLARAADAIGHGPTIAVDERGPEEVRHVAVAFNGMQARIDRLVADRTHALAAVSHDLRTPITRLRLRAGFMADPELQSAVDADLDEMEAMIDSTLAYLRGDAEPEDPRRTDLASMLSTIVDDASDGGRSATFDGPRHAFTDVRPLAVKRAFANLIDNALTHGGCARVALSDEGALLRVTVDDDGPGIAPDDVERMFQPFQRMDASRSRRTGGVGLGLAIVRQAVAREGGTVTLANRAGGGLRAEVTLSRREGCPVQEPRDGMAADDPAPIAIHTLS